MMRMKRLLFVILFVAIASGSYAQITSCAQTLRLARSTYEQGRLHEIPSLLQRCLEKGFSQEEKIEAYKILALSYIYLEEPENADKAMLNILRTDPEFQINPTVDPAEFIALYNSFRTTPIYSIGLKLGPSYNWFNTTSSNGVNDLQGTYGNSVSENKPQLGFQAGVVFDIPFTKKFSVMPEVALFTGRVETNNENHFVSEDEISLGSVQLIHGFTGIQVPINAQYTFFDKKYDPYISLGVTPAYIIQSKITATRFITGFGPVTERTFDSKELINAFTFSAQVSGGVRYKVKRGFLYGEVRYTMGLTTLTKTEEVYSAIPELVFAYGYPANINKLNSISLSVGYMRNQYNPKKKNSR
jgi:hypothetical protein